MTRKNRKQRRLERKTPGQVANEAMQKPTHRFSLPNPEMNGLKVLVESGSLPQGGFWTGVDEAAGSPLTEEQMWRAYEDMKREYIYWTNPSPIRVTWDPPVESEQHVYRYPVKTANPSGFMREDGCLPSATHQSFEEHEVRHTEGTDTVEVWSGSTMLCRIPVTALQAVLMEELY